jgi:hypothetical protein
VLRRYRALLDTMITFRDHLEHFEERLPSKKRHGILKVPGDMFNIVGSRATFGGEMVDAGPVSFEAVAKLFLVSDADPPTPASKSRPAGSAWAAIREGSNEAPTGRPRVRIPLVRPGLYSHASSRDILQAIRRF